MTDEGFKELHKKLFNVVIELPAVKKSGENSHFKNKYAKINDIYDVVKPILNKHKLVMTHPLRGNRVITRITDIETGHYEESWLDIPELTDPQKIGGCVTYFKRYTLVALLGLEDEDDDGNVASGKPAHVKKQSATPQANGDDELKFGAPRSEDKPWANDPEMRAWLLAYKNGEVSKMDICEDSKNWSVNRDNNATLNKLK